MPVFNMQGLPVQLVVQPDKNFANLAAGLQPGQVMRGRVSEVLADGKAIVNFRGVSVTAELKGVSLARGEVISVSVQNLQGQPVLRLLPQASAAVSPQTIVPVPPPALIDAEISSVLTQLNLPIDNFHAAVVQLLQGYSVPPSREAVAAVKELLASLPAFLESPASSTANAPGIAPVPQPIQSAPSASLTGSVAPVQTAPEISRPVASTGPVAEPPLPQPAVNSALSRGYNLGRLLAALDVERAAGPALTPASSAVPPPLPASLPVSSVGQPAGQPGINIAATPANLGVLVSSMPAPVISADATAVAQVLANSASANVPQPLPAILESAVRALESVIQGKAELPAQVFQALTDLTRDLAAQIQPTSSSPVRDLGAAAGRLNAIIRSMPGGDSAPSTRIASLIAGAPEPLNAAPTMPGLVTVSVRSAAELAGALAGIIHEEVAQAVQPQVTIVASSAVATQMAADTSRSQAPQNRNESARAGTSAPVRDSETTGAHTETPRSAAPAPVSLPSAVREVDAPVDVPRIMAVVAETAPIISVPASDGAESVQLPGNISTPVRLVPTKAQLQVLSGAVITVESRAENLASALTRTPGEAVQMPVPVSNPIAPPINDPRVGFVPSIPARDAAGSYGATSSGGQRMPSSEPVQAAFIPVPGLSPKVSNESRSAQVSPLSVQSGQVQMGRDVVETAVFMHAFSLPPAREVARAAHEYLFGQAHLNESLQRFEDVAAVAGARTLPPAVRDAVQGALEAVRDVRLSMDGDEMSATRLQGAVEKLGLGHEGKLARAAGQDGEPKPTHQAAAQAVRGAQDSLKASFIELRDAANNSVSAAQNSQVRETLGAIRSSADDILQVVQSQQVGSVSRSSATQVMYVQLPIQAGNEMRGGEVHLSWKKDGEGKNRRRDPKAPATMMLNMDTRALGPVRVRMQMTGQNLSLVFQVNDPAVQTFLSSEFTALKDRLEGFSLRVDRCVAEVAKEEGADESPRAIAPTSTVDFRA